MVPMERQLEVISEEDERTLDFSSMSKDSNVDEMLTETDNTIDKDVMAKTDDTTDGIGQTGNKSKSENTSGTDDRDNTEAMGETDDRNNLNDKDDTKIAKCVEETDIGEITDDLKDGNKCGKATNGKRRIVRWKNAVGSSEDGCTSKDSDPGNPKDTDPENPTLHYGSGSM